MNARKGNITVEPYTRSVRTVQREGRKSLNFPSTLFSCRPFSKPSDGPQAANLPGKPLPVPDHAGLFVAAGILQDAPLRVISCHQQKRAGWGTVFGAGTDHQRLPRVQSLSALMLWIQSQSPRLRPSILAAV